MLKTLESIVAAFERGRMNRRELIGAVGAMIAMAGGARAGGARVAGSDEKSDNTFTAGGLDHIALDVTDIPRSRDWYMKHLGLTKMSESERSCFLRCGPDFLAMFKSEKPGLNHYCYSIENYDAGEAVETLKAAGLDPHREENRVYFDDPDGITVQVSNPNR